jgi:hypothetical protein
VTIRDREQWPQRAPKRRRGRELRDCRTKSQNGVTGIRGVDNTT